MVGMHTAGFDRLVKALDEYAARHPERDVLIQKGSSPYQPRYARSFDFKPHLRDEIAAAEAVVSQGSVGFLDALRAGKRLVVAPRLARFGEIIDDHQVRFAQSFSARYGFPVVSDMAALESALEGALRGPAPKAMEAQAPTGLQKELERYLARLGEIA